MNIEQTKQNKLSLYRKLVFGLSGVLFVLIITGVINGIFPIAGLILMLFLGVTNFGRQCPLLLSLRNYINRIKTKDKISNTKD
jgi:hypothetical protein